MKKPFRWNKNIFQFLKEHHLVKKYKIENTSFERQGVLQFNFNGRIPILGSS